MPISRTILDLSDLENVGLMRFENCQLGNDPGNSLLKAAGKRVVNSRNGPFSVVSNTYDTANPLPASGFLDFHTDGLYCQTIPDVVLFYCEDPGDDDCSTVLSDTRAVIERLKERGLFEAYGKLQVTYQFDQSGSRALPIIAPHPLTGQPIIHIAGNSTTSVTSEQSDLMEAIEDIYRLLEESIVSEHKWEQGDLLVFDNHSFVHRRQRMPVDARRRLIRLWLNYDNE